MILSDDVGGGNAPVCIAFEKVLNNTCITPEKLPCNWPLPSGEKRFKKVTWHPVDWRGYLMTLKDYGNDVNSIPQDLREKTWKRDEPRIRREFERGEKTLAVTTVDIDNNGTPEEVVRLGFVPCSVGSGFFVIQPKTRKYDKEFRYMLQKPNFSNCSEIMFYDGHSYIFAWDDAWKLLMVWQGFYFTGPLSMEQCRFKYQKGGKKK